MSSTNPIAASKLLAGSGTTNVAASEVVNLLLFQMPKSEPSTTPSAEKSPEHQAAVAVNLLEFQMPKSDSSTTPSRFASPGP
jgi:hypothetical protein